MAGSITAYETKAGTRYRVRYRKPNGAQTDKRGFKTKRDAKLFLAEIQVSKSIGNYLDPSNSQLTIEILASTWLNGHLLTLKPSSQNVMETTWRVHVRPEWGNQKVSTIRPSQITAWTGRLLKGTDSKKPLSPQTARRAVFVLSLILENGVRDRIIPFNPAKGVKLPPKTRKPSTYLSHKQVELLASNSTNPDLIRFLAYTGLRWGEMAALQKKHLDLHRRRMRIETNVVYVRGENKFGTPKTGETRTVPIPEFLTFTLKRLTQNRPDQSFVFGTDLTPIPRPHSEYSWFANAVRKLMAEDATFPRVTPHDLRHTAASLAVSAGANVKAIQRMLGHTSAAMTLDIYADLFDEDLDSVAVSLSNARNIALSV